MPIWLRKFTYKKIEKFYIDKAEKIEEQNNVISNTSDISKTTKVAKPPQSNNTYNTKVSK